MSINPIIQAGTKAKGKRPYFFSDQDVEKVMSITMAVAQELAVARQRIDTLERLLEQKGVLARDEIEGFAPDAEATRERSGWHQEYIARILRIIQQEREAISESEPGGADLDEIVKELA